jgi:hypothetical protein
MNYEEVFVVFWDEVKKSVKEGTFAKLTLAKTIGKLELKNIFVRPISFEENSKLLVKHSYRPREMEDVEIECTLDEVLEILKINLKKPFLSALLFTTTKDVTFKINKKGAGSITENYPTFQNVTLAEKKAE